ncbi:hypothetical protein Pint_32917 [Pistacia integerrima]|uniref:Uncharacterized protein n=1 Tax=Pistacia integerrima TaxID=434235 RepID=A0ACC0X8H0_9ROSI|nr:hypothetical protein Pint_32917 [Pistacia integerrima]
MLQELVTPEMFEEDRRMPLLDMLLTFAALNSVNNIYAEMEKVKKASLAQVEEMEVELNISKVELVKRNEAMAAKQKELEDL